MNRCIGLLNMALITGCTSISGYNASNSYACKAPDGVACDSISGVYANALHNRLPSQQSEITPVPAFTPGERVSSATSPDMAALRSGTRVMRLWVKPWEDSDGDLHDQSYLYLRIDEGRWQLEHVQQQVREAYAPLRPPPVDSTTPTEEAARQRPSIIPLEGLNNPFDLSLDDEEPRP